MEKINYKVYMHISPSGKKYIGITKQSLKKRFDNGRGYKGCFRFKKAIDKYGWENIEHILLKDNLTQAEAKKMEIDLISKYKTTDNRFGYNCSIGGNVPFITEEMYQNLKTSEDKESVHLCDYPEVNEKWLNQEL